jgi:ribosomal protein S18 acetylase RimI-like enzyme
MNNTDANGFDMNPIIRDAYPHDFDEIASVSVVSYQEYAEALTPENWEIMKQTLSSISRFAEPATFIVGEHNNRVIGSVAYYSPGYSDIRIFPSDWASIRLLAVLPEYRGRGIGKALTQTCIERAKRDGAEVIGLYTSELMVTAREMYAQLGFQQDIELPQRLGIRYWRYVMQLDGAVD